MNKAKRVKLKEKLKEIFNDLVFDEINHVYSLKSKPNFEFSTSASKTAEKYASNQFDEKYWAQREAVKTGETIEEVIKRWRQKREDAQKRGNEIHKELENYTNDNRRKASPLTKSINKWFIENGFRLIVNELRIYDEENKICGTLDKLAYNINDGCFYIFDYKTNREKKLDKVETYIDKVTGELKKSKFLMKFPFDTYPDSKYYKYSIQLSIYKYILEKKTDIKIKGLKLIHISDIIYPETGFKVIDAELMNVDLIFNVKKK